ncbi:hypothetical protein AgCh_023155 [Apium graveolens]
MKKYQGLVLIPSVIFLSFDVSAVAESSFFTHDDTNSGLVGWWAGISEEKKHPYGQLIHISAEEGRYLARIYSPWQLAAAKKGTPVFEIYVTTGLQGEYKEQWAEMMMKFMAATGNYMDDETVKNFAAKHRSSQHISRDIGTEFVVDSLEEKIVAHFVFTIGDIVDKVTRNLGKKVLRVPGTLERKECFSFCLKLEKDQHVSDDHNLEVYRTTDYSSLDFVDCAVRGIPQGGYGRGRSHEIYFTSRRAQNQQPLLSRLTTFNRIDVPSSSDPLNGLCIGSNGYLASEVIQLRRLFGPWPEIDSTKEVSEPELCEYVEAVNLTGDFDVPAGQASLYTSLSPFSV